MGPGQLVKRTLSRSPSGQGKPDCTWHYSVPYAVPACQIGLAVGELAQPVSVCPDLCVWGAMCLSWLAVSQQLHHCLGTGYGACQSCWQ